MEVTRIKCNCCGIMIEDIHNEIGWVTLPASTTKGITISGGRRQDRTADTFRYIAHVGGDIHLCGHKCLLNWLYLSDSCFNNDHDTLDSKLKKVGLDSIERLKALTNLVDEIKVIIGEK